MSPLRGWGQSQSALPLGGVWAYGKMLDITHKTSQWISIEDLSWRHYVAQKKGINGFVYKPVHRYAVELLRNSKFYVKTNRVAVDPFIVLDLPPQI